MLEWWPARLCRGVLVQRVMKEGRKAHEFCMSMSFATAVAYGTSVCTCPSWVHMLLLIPASMRASADMLRQTLSSDTRHLAGCQAAQPESLRQPSTSHVRPLNRAEQSNRAAWSRAVSVRSCRAWTLRRCEELRRTTTGMPASTAPPRRYACWLPCIGCAASQCV